MIDRDEAKKLLGCNVYVEMKLKNGVPIHRTGLLESINMKYAKMQNGKNRRSMFKMPLEQIISIKEYHGK